MVRNEIVLLLNEIRIKDILPVTREFNETVQHLDGIISTAMSNDMLYVRVPNLVSFKYGKGLPDCIIYNQSKDIIVEAIQYKVRHSYTAIYSDIKLKSYLNEYCLKGYCDVVKLNFLSEALYNQQIFKDSMLLYFQKTFIKEETIFNNIDLLLKFVKEHKISNNDYVINKFLLEKGFIIK